MRLSCPVILICLIMLIRVEAGEIQPIETGTITWGRDLEVALAQSRKSGKPIFLLFQEVPGCDGCRQFGREVLSNPTLKACIEEAFVPLLIHNNKSGEDGRVRQIYDEPAWNYQVVRFLSTDGKDIIPRRDKVWDARGIALRMIQVLQLEKRPVPGSLEALAGRSGR